MNLSIGWLGASRPPEIWLGGTGGVALPLELGLTPLGEEGWENKGGRTPHRFQNMQKIVAVARYDCGCLL